MKTFGVGKHSAKVTQTEANAIAALPVAQRGPRLFNRVYGIGNPTKMREFGNTGPNDGWLYRGGGMMQCTGKSNYAKMAKKIGLPLVEHPELLHQPDSAFEVAYLDWAQDGRANCTADAIPQNFKVNIAANRKVINGGTNGLAEYKLPDNLHPQRVLALAARGGVISPRYWFGVGVTLILVRHQYRLPRRARGVP